jgi:hypothetical protein
VDVGGIVAFASGIVTHYDAVTAVHTLRTHDGVELRFQTSEYIVVPEPGQYIGCQCPVVVRESLELIGAVLLEGQKWRCGIALPYLKLHDHTENECPMRLVTCRLGCGAVMQVLVAVFRVSPSPNDAIVHATITHVIPRCFFVATACVYSRSRGRALRESRVPVQSWMWRTI